MKKSRGKDSLLDKAISIIPYYPKSITTFEIGKKMGITGTRVSNMFHSLTIEDNVVEDTRKDHIIEYSRIEYSKLKGDYYEN